jgi:hypothetical protein
MVARAGSHLLAATAFAVLAGAGLSAGSARAQNSTCLASPNGAAPAGTHWYYKTDQATHQKCWYTRSQDQAAQEAPAQAAPSQTAPAQRDADNPDAGAVPAPGESAAPVALGPAASPSVQERPAATAPPALRHSVTPSARVPVPAADPRGEQQPVTTAATAAPPSTAVPGAPDNIAWPDPPTMPQATGPDNAFRPANAGSQADASGPPVIVQGSTADSPPATDSPSAAAAPVPNASGRPPVPAANKPDGDSTAGKADADTPAQAKPAGRISELLVLAGLIVLLIAGMLLRKVVEHALGRRPGIKLARQEPRLVEPIAVPPPTPTLLRHAPSVVPSPAQTEQRANEVEDALRKLAQNLRQRRPAANGTIGRSGAAVRS